MSKRHLYVLTGILTLVALAAIAYRTLVLDYPLEPEQTTETWVIETKVQFTGLGRAAKVTLMIPPNAPGLTLVDQSFVARGYGFATTAPGDNRRVIFSTRSARGLQAVYYRAVVHRSRTRGTERAVAEPEFRRSGWTGARAEAGRSIARAIEATAADTETLVRQLVHRLKEPPAQGAAQFLLGKNPNQRRLANVAVNVLRLANIPARTVHGLALLPDRRLATFSHWIEVYDDRGWRPYDLTTEEFRRPIDHLPWWRGGPQFVNVQGGRDVQTTVSVRRSFELTLKIAATGARSADNPLQLFSLFSLPLATQEVYRTLLAVPMGIFLLVILRNVIGIKTFGTFMPVLIALAFRQTDLLWGLILFSIVLGVGLGVRFYLEQLKLLLVPRLGAVVIVVIGIMALLSLVSHKLGFERGLSVALFPIVILSMTIERMTIVWDERGAKEAFQQAGGSLAVAVLCFLVMNISYVQHFLFVFPEALLILLAATMLLGRYSGYRLVELPRFRVLAGKG